MAPRKPPQKATKGSRKIGTGNARAQGDGAQNSRGCKEVDGKTIKPSRKPRAKGKRNAPRKPLPGSAPGKNSAPPANKSRGLDFDSPLIDSIRPMFVDMVKRAMAEGFKRFLWDFKDIALNVGTMCSGTEAPLLGIAMIREAIKEEFGMDLKIVHRYSAEIEPYKQAYIDRNFDVKFLFRDIREMGHSDNNKATNAYGSLIEIPTDIDIVIAGFPCVDFSAKNKHKKGIEEFGETGDVLLGILLYAKKYRPAIIILENVEKATWPLVMAIWRNDVQFVKNELKELAKPWLIWDKKDPGYTNVLRLVDTKEYYLPQTRRRGYLFLVRKDLAVRKEKDVLKHWGRHLRALERPASASVEAFLFPNNHPVVQQTKLEASKVKKGRRETDWTLCKGRHQKYRNEIKVGDGRPLTKWVEGGRAICPDHWWRHWAAAQVERIWDTVDIAYLRNAQQDIDTLYIMRIYELSQNVDYDKDRAPPGIISCITPTGMPFFPHLGRILAGMESLILQGLPVWKLNLTKETVRDLYDLAGNAMSTTVVTAAFISALMAGRGALKKNIAGRSNEVIEQATVPEIIDVKSGLLQKPKPLIFNKSRVMRPTPAVIRGMVTSLTRLCRCETTSLKITVPLLECQDCGHLCCEKCSGSPPHRYEITSRPDRFLSRMIQEGIEDSVPMRIRLGINKYQLDQIIGTFEGTLNEGVWEYVSCVLKYAAATEFVYRSIERGRYWTAIYEAEDARLELIMSENETCWLLFGKVHLRTNVDSDETRVLRHPVSRMIAHGSNLLQGSWEVRLPVDTVFDLSIRGQGKTVPSWKANLGLLEFTEEKMWSSLHIECETSPENSLSHEIDGDYVHLPKCGTPQASLYKKIPLQGGGSNPSDLFFFLDRDRVEGPVKDQFVFATNTRRLEYGELRNPVARLGPQWRPTSTDFTITQCHVQGKWIPCGMSLKPVGSNREVTYAEPRSKLINDVFSKTWQISLNSGAFKYDCRSSTENYLAFTMPSALVEQLAGYQTRRLGAWEIISPDDGRLRNFSWLFTKVKKLESFPDSYQPMRPPFDNTVCKDCVPKPPETKWHWSGKASKAIKPYEDALQASIYERALKARPSPFIIRYFVSPQLLARFEIGFNLEALSHRVCGKLGGIPPASNGELHWRLDRSFDKSNPGKLQRFKIKSNAKDSGFHAEIPINEDESAELDWEDMHGFRPELGEGLKAYLRELEIKAKDKEQSMRSLDFPNRRYALRKEQKRSLTWMLRQESDGAKPWKMQEVEEAILPALGWRAEVRGTKETRVWGGVLADTVGYGKTATTLALAHQNSQRTREEAKMHHKGFITLKATLLLAPPTLIGQWDDEIDKFLGKDLYTSLVIENQTKLNSTSIAEFEAADFVIVNYNLLNLEGYWKKVAAFAALPNAPTLGGRGFASWLKRARGEIKNHIDDLQTRRTRGSLARFATRLDQKYRTACNDPSLAYEIPQKRLKGAKYVSWEQLQAAKSQKADKKEDRETKEENRSYSHLTPVPQTDADPIAWKNCKGPSLEFFRFARLIVEEHTYVEQKILGAIENLNAPRRWILSATPLIAKFSDLRRMARLIGADIGVDDESMGSLLPDVNSSGKKDQSEAEQFRTYKHAHSIEWHEIRHKHAQKFLDQFCRQNVPRFGLATHYLVRPIGMTTAQKIVHRELQAILEKSNMQITKSNTTMSSRGETIKQPNPHIEATQNGFKALLRSLSFPEKEESLTAIRQRRFDDLEQFGHLFTKTIRHAAWLEQQLSRLATKKTEKPVRLQDWLDSIIAGDLKSERAQSMIVQSTAAARDAYDPHDEAEFYRAPITEEEKAQEVEQDKLNKRAAQRAKKPYEEPMRLPFKIATDDFETFKATFRLVVRDLRKMTEEYKRRDGSLNFMTNLEKLFFAESGQGAVPHCEVCGSSPEHVTDLTISVACGHLICETCTQVKRGDDDDEEEEIEFCRYDPCDIRVVGTQLKHIGDFIGSDDGSGTTKTKVQTVIDLIHSFPDGEYTIVFCQFDSIMYEIGAHLTKMNKSHVALTDEVLKGDVWNKVSIFQDPLSSIEVVMLNPENLAAAGTNLQSANRIIFMSPIDAPSQYHYMSTKTQCVGRALRMGQKKDVWVYNILTLHTIEVDIFEHRDKKKLIKTDAGEWVAVPKKNLQPERLARLQEVQRYGSGGIYDWPELEI